MKMLARYISLRLGLLAIAGSLAASRPEPLAAAAPVASLDIVPADAAFYSAMLRNREQYDAIVNSKAFAKIKELPYVQMGLGLYAMQTANPETIPGRYEAAMNNPEFKKSMQFVADIMSDEVFIYGGSNFTRTLEFWQKTYGAVQMAAFQRGFATAAENAANRARNAPPKQAPDKASDEEAGKAFVQALVENIDLITVPDLVIGFKVKDKVMAEKLLKRLDTELAKAFAESPMFEGRFKRSSVAGNSYLTLTLDANMVPWEDEFVEKIRSLAASPADGDKLIERLKKTKLVIALGLRDDFLLLTFGPSTDVLANLGKTAALGTRPELAAVGKFADKRIASVGYSSKALNEQLGFTRGDVDNLAVAAKGMLSSLSAPAKLQKDLAKTVDELAKDLKSVVTAIGANTWVSLLTSSGCDKYFYDWSDHPEVDCSKPLDILKHIGGNPIAVIAGRAKVSIEDYDLLVKWIQTGYRYFEEYGVPQIPPKERGRFDQLIGDIKSLTARFNKTTRESLLPALADGQSALVLDAKLTSRQFIKSLPPTEKALPMLEPAIVLGVSDAAKLKQAFTEYYAEADDLVEGLKAIDAMEGKAEIPKDFKLPRPKDFNLLQGAVYGYALPAEWGVDGRVMPNAGVSKNVAVLSLSGRQTQRLLSEKEPTVAGIKLPTDGAYGGVAAFDFAALIDAATPWIDLALDQAALHGAQDNIETIRLHTKTVIQVLKVYRGTVSETYLEGKVTVTRTRSEYHDVDE